MKNFVVLLTVVILVTNLSGCIGPPLLEKIVEIKTHETAFVVPLEGPTKSKQGKFMSEDYLAQKKIATKRISLPQREKFTGRMPWHYEWIPTARVIVVNRTPVTREWTADELTGTEKRDQSIKVESKDSIGFKVGVNITSFVDEGSAAKFLYSYSGKTLKGVMDGNIRGYVTSILSREFGSRNLKLCKTDKKEISDILLTETKEEFKKRGVTIGNIGLVGGLMYTNPEIQRAINDTYVAEMKVQQSEQERLGQERRNQMNVSVAEAEASAAKAFSKAAESRTAQVRLEIEKMRAEAYLKAATRWNGVVPQKILPQGSQFLFGLDGSK